MLSRQRTGRQDDVNVQQKYPEPMTICIRARQLESFLGVETKTSDSQLFHSTTCSSVELSPEGRPLEKTRPGKESTSELASKERVRRGKKERTSERVSEQAGREKKGRTSAIGKHKKA